MIVYHRLSSSRVNPRQSGCVVRPTIVRTFPMVACMLALAAAAVGVRAQASDLPAPTDGADRHWWTLWTRPSDQDRVIWGMWTLHVNHVDEGWSNDGMFAAVYRSLYAASFETTHGPRGYTLGFERLWGSVQRGPVEGIVGFRTGLVYGYDGRLGWMAEKYPVLPFAQPAVYLRVGPFITDFTYTWVVVSFTAGVRF